MPIATLNSDGGITIPVAVRIALGLDSGSLVEFVEMGNGRYAFIAAAGTVESLKGGVEKIRCYGQYRTNESDHRAAWSWAPMIGAVAEILLPTT